MSNESIVFLSACSYNQSYQFDTLPLKISKEEMKPGDLVFLQAPYYDKSRKPQTHGMS